MIAGRKSASILPKLWDISEFWNKASAAIISATVSSASVASSESIVVLFRVICNGKILVHRQQRSYNGLGKFLL